MLPHVLVAPGGVFWQRFLLSTRPLRKRPKRIEGDRSDADAFVQIQSAGVPK